MSRIATVVALGARAEYLQYHRAMERHPYFWSDPLMRCAIRQSDRFVTLRLMVASDVLRALQEQVRALPGEFESGALNTSIDGVE